MAELNKSDLKAIFKAGAIPTEAQFADLIESQINTKETASLNETGSTQLVPASGFFNLRSAQPFIGLVTTNPTTGSGMSMHAGFSSDLGFRPLPNSPFIKTNGGFDIFMDNGNESNNSQFRIFKDTGALPGIAPGTELLKLNEVGGLSITGSLTSSGDINITGSITCSFISASGTIIADTFQSSTTTLSVNDSLNVVGNITASGNISASGNITSSNIHIVDEHPKVNLRPNTANGDPQVTFKNSLGEMRGQIRVGITSNTSSFMSIGADTTDPSNPTTSMEKQLYLSASGDVGIGFMDPSEKLMVSGNLKVTDEHPKLFIQSNAASGDPTLQFKSGDGSTMATIRCDVTNNVMNQLSIGSGTNETHLVVDANGNIGVGLLTPGEKLTVTGNVSASGALTVGALTANGAVDLNATTLDIDTSGAVTIDAAGAASHVSIVTAHTAGDAFHLDANANVGSIVNIDAGILDIDSDGATTINAASTVVVTGATGATFGDDTESIIYDGSGNLDLDAVALDIDASAAVTIDGAGISLDSVGVAANLTVASDGDAEDLTISVTGATNSSLKLLSSGTGADALQIHTTAGSIEIESADNLTAEVADEISLQTTSADGHITLASAHTSGVAFHLDANADAASEVQIDAGVLDIDVTAAATIDAVGVAIGAGSGELDLTTTGTMDINSAALDIDASGAITIDGVGLSIDSTGVAANITSTTDGAAEDFTIALAGATDSSLILSSTGTGADALQITTTAGGIDISATGNAAGEDIDISSAASVNITATEDAANAIHLRANGGTSETIKIHSDQGTSVTEGAASISLLSDAGGVELRSTANLANSIRITADGGTSETIKIHSDQGTSSDTISLISDAGGILLSGTKGVKSKVANGIAAGGGIDAVSPEIQVGKYNGEIVTTIFIDIGAGSIVSGTDTGDVIGEDGVANAYVTQITSAKNGIVYKGEIVCLEVPTTGDPDINVAANSSGTIAEDAGGEGQHVLANCGTHTLALKTDFTIPAGGIQDDFIYLTHGGTTAGTYDAGKFYIRFYGVSALGL